MANKKITWKNFIANMPKDATTTINIDPSLFGVDSLEIKRTLDMNEMTEFVSNVVTMCIDSDAAEYVPESYDFAIRLNVLSMYAGIPLPTGKDGAVQSMLKKAYFVLYETDLCDKITACINQVQFKALLDSISERIRFERDMMVSSAAQKVNELIGKMDEVMSESQNVLGQIDSENFGKALESMSKIGLLGEDVPQPTMHDAVTESVLPHDLDGDNIVLMKPNANFEK